MALETYTANDVVYTVSPETELPDGMKTWAVLEVLLVDEISGQGPTGAVALQTDFVGLSPRIAPGGKIGFAAIPLTVFPQLRSKDYPVSYTIEAEGYLPLQRTDTFLFASNVNFPQTFSQLDVGALSLHRSPTTMTGSVVLNTGIAVQAIPGATISLTGLAHATPGHHDSSAGSAQSGFSAARTLRRSYPGGQYGAGPGFDGCTRAGQAIVAAGSDRCQRGAPE
jgi:hypothetical protein